MPASSFGVMDDDALLDWQILDGFRAEFEGFLKRFSGCFDRSEGREHLRRYVRGQCSDLPRKNCEAIADQQGVAPRTLQYFLATQTWDPARATDILQRIVADEHADPQSEGLIDWDLWCVDGSWVRADVSAAGAGKKGEPPSPRTTRWVAAEAGLAPRSTWSLTATACR